MNWIGSLTGIAVPIYISIALFNMAISIWFFIVVIRPYLYNKHIKEDEYYKGDLEQKELDKKEFASKYMRLTGFVATPIVILGIFLGEVALIGLIIHYVKKIKNKRTRQS